MDLLSDDSEDEDGDAKPGLVLIQDKNGDTNNLMNSNEDKDTSPY
jgi:hypothetical protein